MGLFHSLRNYKRLRDLSGQGHDGKIYGATPSFDQPEEQKCTLPGFGGKFDGGKHRRTCRIIASPPASPSQSMLLGLHARLTGFRVQLQSLWIIYTAANTDLFLSAGDFVTLPPLGTFFNLQIDTWVKFEETAGDHPIMNERGWEEGFLHYQIYAGEFGFAAPKRCINPVQPA